MSDYKIGSVVFNPAPNAAQPRVPTGYQGQLVGCGDGETRIADIGGLMHEVERLRSEIATLMGHNAEYAKRHVAQLAETERLRSEISLRDRCIAWVMKYTELDQDAYLEVPAEFAAIIGVKA